ncbi:MAG: ion channel [Saprospiraceae bacterium]
MKRIPRRILAKPIQQELGFGKQLTTSERMMNPDGSFNVERQTLGRWDNAYYHLVTMRWDRFALLVFLSFVLLNLFFSALYLSLGIHQLQGIRAGDFWQNLSSVFFFSTQTLTTVGYGHVSPAGWGANVVASLESFTGLLVFALISGLLYGRFSRPAAKIAFSHSLLVAPYREGTGLMLRMANARKSELIETDVQVFLAINQADETGNVTRRFFGIPLEISKISFFSLSWTVVHPIDENSPLWGVSQQDLQDARAEFMVLVKGVDEATQQLVHARRSYTGEEMIFNARFKPVIGRNASGLPKVLIHHIGAYETMA